MKEDDSLFNFSSSSASSTLYLPALLILYLNWRTHPSTVSHFFSILYSNVRETLSRHSLPYSPRDTLSSNRWIRKSINNSTFLIVSWGSSFFVAHWPLAVPVLFPLIVNFSSISILLLSCAMPPQDGHWSDFPSPSSFCFLIFRGSFGTGWESVDNVWWVHSKWKINSDALMIQGSVLEKGSQFIFPSPSLNIF